ncbi:helix-turn-helix domain-containing protein [Paenibacillus sp. YN15]|uniref:helix-turn-helix domain-containing protein n=1 Tax=Paenibacillus sp. YN15 TaxID=1742774 RepID=UPI000DD5B297|nr:helix-turn-helix domain-containing protein [Paenibacillus sp. YN15]
MTFLRRINRLYRKKWIVFALLFSTIPILVFGLFMYVTGSRLINNEIENASLSSIGQLKEQVDIIISQVEQFSGQYALQSNAMEFTRVGQTPSLRSMLLTNELNQDLVRFVSSMESVHSAYLYHIPQQLVITNLLITSLQPEERMEFASPFKDVGWIDGLKKAAEAHLQEYWVIPRYVQEGQGETKVLTYVRLLPLFYDEPKSALVINIRTNFIGEIIRSFPLNTKGALMVFSREGELITAVGDTSGMSEEVLEQLKIRHLAGEQEDGGKESFSLRLADGSTSVATLDRSAKKGWTYLMLVPSGAVSRNVELLKHLVLLLTLLLSVAAGILSFFSFRPFRRGIRRIGDILLNRGGKLGGAGQQPAWGEEPDQFGHIEHRIAHLFDEVEEVREQWREQLPLLRSHFLLSVLLGQRRSLERLSVPGTDEMQVFPHKRFCLYLVEMDDGGEEARFRRKDRDLFLYAVSNIAKELFMGGCTVETVLTRRQAVIIMNYPEDWEPEELVRKADTLRALILRFLKQTVTIVVGESKDSLEELSPSFMESQEAFQWLRQGNQVLRVRHAANPDQLAPYPEELEQQLADHLAGGEYEEACRAADSFFRYMDQHELPSALRKNYSLQLLVSLMRLLQKYETAGNKAFSGRNPYGELLVLESGVQTFHWFRDEFLRQAAEFLDSLKKRHVKEAVAQTLAIIEKHYAQDLSLQLAADMLRMNAYQLSKLFKEEMGENFIQFVTRYRVEKVKAMLLETELTVSQIAEAVGYSNAQQLIRVFKKLEHTTPGEFRAARTGASP